jgi:Protein of unknown function (DUF2924)
MQLNLTREVAALERLTTQQLRVRYAEAFGEPTNTKNKAWLVKRIAWRLQALVEGDLSERARQRAAELACDADLRLSPPRVPSAAAPAPLPRTEAQRTPGDRRLPVPGTILTRPYRGDTLQVQVLAHGFEFQGALYPSLSAVAKAISGTHCNGYQFFRLGSKGGDR